MRTRFRPYRRLEQLNIIIALPLAAMMVPFPVAAQSAPVVAPNSGNTRVYTTPGGVPVEEIATANAAGLSHNKFTSYDVPTQGLVVNNAAPTQFTVNSQLAGSVSTNFNLRDPASVILNEVVAPNASTIAGFTEIVGGKADLIVANPYGIAVKGAGFINTDQVTLATATPIIGANGALAGLHVTGGDLSISGTGLNASNVGLLNLLARSIKVDGQVNGQDVFAAAGANDFDYASRTVKANGQATGTTPAYAIDSSALGGMYANRIRLLATDVGVGVRMLGDAAATADDLTLNAAGKVELANKAYAERDANITGAGVTLSGAASSLTAKRDISLGGGSGDLTLTDANLVAGHNLALAGATLTDTSATPQTAANRFAVGTLTVTTTGNAAVSGSGYGAGGALAWQSGATAFSNQASFYSGADGSASDQSLSFHATTGDLDVGTAQMQSQTALSLTADHGRFVSTAGGDGAAIQAGTNIAILAGTGISNGANLTAGSILSIDAANAVSNTGKLIAGSALTIGSGSAPTLTLDNGAAGVIGGRTVDVRAASLANAGVVQATQGLTATVTNALTNAGNAAILTAGEAGRDVSISAGSFQNNGYVQSTGTLKLSVAADATNAGVIATQSSEQGGADGGVTFLARSLTNSGTIQSAGALSATLNGATGTTLANSGTIQAIRDTTLNAGVAMTQSATGAILTGGALALQSGAGAFSVDTAGRIQAGTTLTLGGSDARVALTQRAGAVTLATGAAHVTASSIDNSGILQAGDALAVDATDSIVNQATGGFLTAGNPAKALTVTAATLTNAGQIQSTGSLTTTTSGATNNSGTFLTLDAANGGAAGDIGVTTSTLANSGTVQSAGALGMTATATSGTTVTNSGKLLAQQAITLGTGAGSFENQPGALVVTNDALTLSTAALTNAGTIQSAKDLKANVAGKLDNTASGLLLSIGATPATVTLTSDTLTNAGTLQSSGAFNGTANVITNGGDVLSSGTLALKTATTLTNSGTIQAAAAMTLTVPQTLTNVGNANILGGADITLGSGGGAWTIDNAGRIQAAAQLSIANSDGAVALTNEADGILYAGNGLSATASSITNAGIIRGTTGATLNVTDALANTGTLATAGTPGAAFRVNAGSVTNGGQIQSTGGFFANVGGDIRNQTKAVIITVDRSAGGSNGDIATTSSTFSNDGTVKSAGAIDLVATASGVRTFNNTGQLEAADSIDITAPTRQTNSGVVLAGGDISMQSGGGSFHVANSGTLQAGGDLSIGATNGRVELENGGKGIAGSTIAVRAGNVDNTDTLQATSVSVDATGDVTNAHGASVVAWQDGNVQAATLTNGGTVSAGTNLTIGTVGSTSNTGAIQTSRGNVTLNASDVTNAGNAAISSGNNLSLTTTGGAPVTVTNSGTIQATGNIGLTGHNGIANNGNATINGGGNVTITSGGSGFTLTNAGNVQAGIDLSIGTPTDRVTLDNQGNAVLIAGGNITANATTITNAGMIQGAKGVTLDLTGAFDQTATGNVITSAGANANIALTAASIANAGHLQSSGAITATTPGDITNSSTGTWVTQGTGAISASGATVTNNGVIQSGGTLALTAATDVINTTGARLQSEADMTLTTPHQFNNGGSVISNANIVVVGGSTAFDVLNDGGIQAAQKFTFGSSTARASFTNHAKGADGSAGVLAKGVIQAGDAITGYATTFTNSGVMQAGNGLTLDASGALLNNADAQLFTAGATPSDVKVAAASLTNAGRIEATGKLSGTILGAATNSGVVVSGDALTGKFATLTNSGRIQSANTLTLTATATTGTTVSNSGTMQAANDVVITAPSALANSATGNIVSDGGAVTLVGGSAGFALNNDGLVQAGGAVTLGTTAARATTTNNGTVLATGALTANATTIVNNGTLQSDGDFTANATGAITNHATGLLAVTDNGSGAMSLAASTLTNSGAVQSGGAIGITLSGALNNTGTVLTSRTGDLTATAASLTNSGTLQSGGALTATIDGAFTNSGTVATVGSSAGALKVTAGAAIANNGTVDSAGTLAATAGTTFTNNGTIKATDAMTLTTAAAFINASGAKIAGDDAITIAGTSPFTLSNSGLVQSGAGLTLGDASNLANVTNVTGAILQAGGDLAAFASAMTNSGTVQAGGAATFTLGSSATFTNNAGAKVIAGDGLTIDTSSGGFTINNSGLIQSGGLLTIGGAGRAATINQNGTNARLFADTFAITAGAITNQGMIMGAEGGTLTAASFTNQGQNSRFIAATDSGATTVTISGQLTNEGAIHSNDDLTISAGSLSNTSTGGLSSLGNLTLAATNGDIYNHSDGALYAGGKLTLTASDDIINDEDATIDADGNFAATASDTFTNKGQINIGGSATITARTFQNVMAGAENLTRVWAQPSHIDQGNYIDQGSSDPAPNVSTTKWYYTGHGGYDGSWFDDRSSPVYGFYFNKQSFQGIDDPEATFGGKVKPQIAAANLTVNGFDSGENVGGLLTATGTLAIDGRTSGSSFTNDAMSLDIQKWNYQATWWYDYTVGSYDWWNPTGDKHITDVLKTIAYEHEYFTTGAGLKAGNISVQNVGTLTLIGSAFAPHVSSTSAAGGTVASLASATDVGGAIGASAAGGAVAASIGHAVTLTGADAVALGAVDDLSPAQAQQRALVQQVGSAPGASASDKTAGDAGNANGFAGEKSAAFGGLAAKFSGAQNSAFANALKNATLTLGGITLKLPTNPNGYFVTTADPQAKYIVSVNSTFGIDPSTALGSDFLAQKLGLNPDRIEQRLGDPAYETYLVRQQLVDQLGTKFVDGQKNETQQMEMLMNNAATEAARLGLQFGQAPTASQLASLDQDMVWMVDQVVGGQHVLVPQVYVSAKTRSLFDAGGSTLAGDNVDLDVGNLNNNGGSIAGADTLNIKAKDDINNIGGSITGGDVSLKAGGSITNQTVTAGNDDSSVVGTTATIGSTGTLNLDAGKDIKVLGADVNAGGDASLSAGNQIVVDTVQKKSTTRTESSADWGFGSTKTTTTTTDVANQASNLNLGGNVKIKSGGDTTLAGSNLNVGGNLDTDVGGDLNVLARQDQHTVDTSTSTSGIGVGGGLYGSQTTHTNDFTGKNAGSTINVGGDANLSANKTLTLEGSDLNVKGSGSINATDVQVLDGKDEHHVTTTTTTTTFGIFTDSSASAGAEASASGYGHSASASASKSTEDGSKSEAGTDQGHARLSGEASASAHAEGSAGATIGVRTNTTNTDTYDSTSRASTINFGGDLKINAKNNLTVRGSDVSADGNVDLNAKNMQFLAGQDVHTSSTSSKTTTAGVNFSAEGSADASAEANAGPMGGGASAEANAGGEVGVAIMVQHNETNSNEGSTTARVSTIHSGGNLTRTAENNLTDVGTSIDVGGDLNQSAKTIDSLAAKNTSWSSEDSTTHTGKIGLYADAKASASAEGGANAVGGVEGKAEASASVSAGLKASYSYDNSTSNEQSSEAVVSNITVGGKMTSKSSGKTTLEGTNIQTGGDTTIEAKSLDYKAAQNTSSSSSTETNAEATLKLGVGAGASASTEDGGSAGYGPQGSLAASGGKSTSNEGSTEAVTGSINSGGKLKIKTADDAHFEGTNLQSTSDTTIKAGGNVTFDAAHNTSSSSGNSFEAGGELSASSQGGNKALGLNAEGSYSNEKENSNEAVTGSINSGGKLKIQAGGSASFEGTDVSAGGDATIDAKKDVTFKQATSTSSSSSVDASASLEVGGESNKSEGSSSKSFGASAEGGYSTESEKTAKTSNISTGGGLTIKSGSDVTLQGTNIDAGGDANISAKGNLKLTAKEESSSSFGVSAGLEVGGEKGHDEKGASSKSSIGAEASLEGQSDVTQTGGTIKSGGNVNLSSGKDTTLVGTQVDAAGGINVAAGGTVKQEEAKSSSVGGAIGLSLERESEKGPEGGESKAGAGHETTTAHETKAGETKADENKAGEKKEGEAEKKEEGPENKGGITDLGFNASASNQGTSFKSGSGSINIQSGVAPAGSSVAPKGIASPKKVMAAPTPSAASGTPSTPTSSSGK